MEGKATSFAGTRTTLTPRSKWTTLNKAFAFSLSSCLFLAPVSPPPCQILLLTLYISGQTPVSPCLIFHTPTHVAWHTLRWVWI